MKELFNKINRQSLILGIIGTLVCSYFIQPILEFLGKFIILLFKSFSKTMYNRLFEEIALGKPDYSFTIIMLMSLILINLLIFLIIYSIFKEKIQLLREQKKQKSVNSSKKVSNIFINIFSIILLIIFTYGLTMSNIKLRAIQSFDQQMRIITPYISQHQKDIIISDFSKMKSSEDYIKVINTINLIARQNNIELPEVTNHFF